MATLIQNDRVKIIKGKSHLGETGVIVRLTQCQAWVRVAGVSELVRKYQSSLEPTGYGGGLSKSRENSSAIIGRVSQSGVPQSASESSPPFPPPSNQSVQTTHQVLPTFESDYDWTFLPAFTTERETPRQSSQARVVSTYPSETGSDDRASYLRVGESSAATGQCPRVATPDRNAASPNIRNESSCNHASNCGESNVILFEDALEIASLSRCSSNDDGDDFSMVTADSQLYEDANSVSPTESAETETTDDLVFEECHEFGIPRDEVSSGKSPSFAGTEGAVARTTFNPIDTNQRLPRAREDQPSISSRASGSRAEENNFDWRVVGFDTPPHEFGGIEIAKISLLPKGVRSNKHCTFAHKLFGNRVHTVELPIPKSISNAREIHVSSDVEWHGRRYQLLSSKVHYEGARSYKYGGPRVRVTLQYVAVSGPDLQAIILQDELDKVADFGSLESHKAAARLELFESPASKSNIKARELHILDDLTSSDFEEIPETSNVGCGFVPRSYISRLFGNHAIGKRTCAIQVRIFCPYLGVFKGMLVEKSGIDRIQLPSSMRKVPPSTIVGDDWACLLVTKRLPSTTNVTVAKLLRGEPAPESFKVQGLKAMVPRIWESLGVPRALSQQYIEESSSPEGLQHAFVGGVADPTGHLPEGHVLVPGMALFQKETLFVTRCPCIEPDDGHLLPVVTSKPPNMSSAEWRNLNEMHFGAIIFGNSQNGRFTLPETIANGDLDGDGYFICWNDDIIESVTPAHTALKRAPVETSEPLPTERQIDWLRFAQHQMSDIVSFAELSQLIGKLYSRAVDIAYKSPRRIDDPDCRALGRAYKKALDLGKHGGILYLPRNLWEAIPEHLHQYLTSVER